MEDHERTENANRPEPELLYHYTDQRGLDGILSSASIWATHYKFLNDFSERDHGFGFFSKAIERIHTQPGTTERFSKINLDNFRDAFTRTLWNYFEVTSSFIASLTTDSPYEIENHKSASDRLSQWRGYAFGKQGFCLAFDYAAINKIGDHLHETTKLSGVLRPCIYSDEKKISLAQEIIKPVFDAYFQEVIQAKPSDASVQPFKDLSGKPMNSFNQANTRALFLYSFMKDLSFDEEHEVRLSAVFISNVSDASLVHFREGQDRKVPYIVIPIGDGRSIPSLRKIVVGPSEQKEQQVSLLQFRLQQMGWSKVEVVPSKIPYRNW
jgi:hypothetical protein